MGIKALNNRIENIYNRRVQVFTQHIESLQTTIEIGVGAPLALLLRIGRHGGGVGDIGHQVLDVDEADRVVERLAEYRHARMARLAEFDQEVADGDADVDGIDVGARHHDIVDADLAQPEDVGQHRPFFGREGGGNFIVGKGLGQILADRGGRLEAKRGLETVEPPLVRTLAVGGYSTTTVRIGTRFSLATSAF